MVSKQELADRRLALVRLMCSPAQPSVTDAWSIINQKHPCSLGALREDWDRRWEWIPSITRLDNPTEAAETAEAFKGLAEKAYRIYVKCITNGDYATALNALRTTGRMLGYVMRFYASAGSVCYSQTNVNIFNSSVVPEQPIPKDGFAETLQKIVQLTKKESENTNNQQTPENRLNNPTDESHLEVKP